MQEYVRHGMHALHFFQGRCFTRFYGIGALLDVDTDLLGVPPAFSEASSLDYSVGAVLNIRRMPYKGRSTYIF